MGESNRIGLVVLSYIVLAVITYFALKVYELVSNLIIISLITPLLVMIAAYSILSIKSSGAPSLNVKGKVIRYTMHCLRCNWEWMSNTTEKAPNQCPNCHEKEKLEVIGWRRVNLPTKIKNKDLRGYFG